MLWLALGRQHNNVSGTFFFLQRTSAPSVLGRKDSDLNPPVSTASYRSSCARYRGNHVVTYSYLNFLVYRAGTSPMVMVSSHPFTFAYNVLVIITRSRTPSRQNNAKVKLCRTSIMYRCYHFSIINFWFIYLMRN